MSMQSASLEVLEKANLPAPQARAIVQAIEIEIGAAQNTLATKQDISGLETKMESLRGNLETRLEALRGDFKTLRGDLSTDVEKLRGDLSTDVEKLRGEIQGIGRRLPWQLYGALVTQMTLLVGIAYFFVTHVKP